MTPDRQLLEAATHAVDVEITAIFDALGPMAATDIEHCDGIARAAISAYKVHLAAQKTAEIQRPRHT